MNKNKKWCINHHSAAYGQNGKKLPTRDELDGFFDDLYKLRKN